MMFFKKKSVPSLVIEKENPYLSARREWNERYGSYVSNARQWRALAVLSLLVAGGSVAGNIWLAQNRGLVPYVVAVDKIGQVAGVERADRPGRPENKVIKQALNKWAIAMRSVYVDATAQKNLILEGYAFVNSGSQALTVLNEYMKAPANNPFERAQKETAGVTVETVLPLTDDTWRIEWREEIRDRGGQLLSATPYQATVGLVFAPPADEAAMRLNPFGIYVNTFNWQKRL